MITQRCAGSTLQNLYVSVCTEQCVDLQKLFLALSDENRDTDDHAIAKVSTLLLSHFRYQLPRGSQHIPALSKEETQSGGIVANRD